MTDLEKKKLHEEFISISNDDNTPKLYANSFSNFVGISDVSVLLKKNGKPEAILNMSYTTAKSLAQKITEGIAMLEHKSSNKIMSADQVENYLKQKD